MTKTLVRFDRVAKSYKSFQALHDVSFTLNEGEIFGYIGPNGAGKTTTLKLLVGLLLNFEGSIQVDDLVLPRDQHRLHEMVGYLPQYPEFQAWRTVDHALMTLGRLSDVSVADLKARIPKLLERFNLGDVRHKKIRKLSGGMKQKVGFVQALLHRPKLLVLDEPLSGLDPDSRIRLKEEILALKQAGTTVIFSSHILGDVQDVADRMGIIQGGRILKTGNMQDLQAHFGVAKEIQVAYTSLPGDLTFLSQFPHVNHVLPKEGNAWSLQLTAEADIDALVHQVIVQSMAQGGQIRRIGEIAPSLDELYKRFTESPTQPAVK
jgi:ABC-2 type transport system ATP-binding protein